MKKKFLTVCMIAMMSVSLMACSGSEKVSAKDNEEYSDEFILEAAKDTSPAIDISGCDTFTQIIDKKLTPGMGYANVKIGDEDALLVCSNVYDDMSAIDATVFIYKDGAPYEAGSICSAGTAYPLVEGNGAVYSASNHWVCKYTIENGSVIIAEKVASDEDISVQMLYKEMTDGETIHFDVIKESADISDNSDVTAQTEPEDVLPAYEYPGPEQFYSEVYGYIIDEFSKGYEPADVSIPSPIIVKEDVLDNGDINLYGDFWVYNYNLNGDTLECASGGSYPGCMHIKKGDNGYEVVSFDMVGNGSEFEPSAKKIFGDYYEDFMKAEADEEAREKDRAQIIANFVAANDLDISQYKDFGWDPVTLPKENIDSFYSILD